MLLAARRAALIAPHIADTQAGMEELLTHSHHSGNYFHTRAQTLRRAAPLCRRLALIVCRLIYCSSHAFLCNASALLLLLLLLSLLLLISLRL